MDAMAAGDRDIPADLRRRAGHPRGDAGPARVRLRGAVAAVCPRPPSASVSLPARPVRVQQAGAQAGRYHVLAIRMLACDTSLWGDDVWLVDSTPVECGRSKDTVRRSDLAGCAGYGYCASHSRYFWGLRLHLLCTLHGLPVSFALTGATADERETLLSILDDPALTARRAGQVIIADKNYYGHDFEAALAAAGLVLLRPARN